MFPMRTIQNFAVDSGLNEHSLKELMYPPRPQRNIKTQRQVFIPPSFVAPSNGSQIDVSSNSNKKGSGQSKLVKRSLKNMKNLDSEIQRLFKSLKDLKERSENEKSNLVDTDLRNFILFQPVLKDSFSIKICLTYYSLVKKRGSFLDVLGANELPTVIKEFQEMMMLEQGDFSLETYFELYKKHILAYEMYKSNKLQMMKPVDIDKVKYYTMDEIDKIIKAKREDIQFDNKDVFVMKGFSEYVGFDEQILSIEYFNKHYGDKTFDTRIQRSDAFGFDVLASFMNNEQQQMNAAQYIRYQALEGTPEVKKLPIYKKLKKNEVCFAVNVELIGKDEISKQIHDKLQKVKYVQYINQFDVLSYCEKWIPGCNHPQFYFKVKGVWTGGHQENVCMSSVNVNFGPDDSQWFTLAIEHVPRFRKQVLQQFGIDIIEQEGLWFAPPEWLIVNNYPIKKLIQKKGDLVYSGPGTLHWVRSLGKCLQVAWNIFPKTTKQWKQAVTRTEINQQISFHQIFMPLKSLAIKILNHEYQTRTSFVEVVEQSLRGWFKQQLKQIQKFEQQNGQIKNIKYRYLSDIESLCQNCRSQVLTIYSLDVQNQTVCFKCFIQTASGLRRNLFLKHNPQYISKLLIKIQQFKQAKQTISNQSQIPQLCSRVYCGTVNCSLSSNPRTNPFTNLKSSDYKSQSQLSSILPQAPIDPTVLLQLFTTQMPKQSWNSTEQVLEVQAKIISQKSFSLNNDS